jgi:hypothetical protein
LVLWVSATGTDGQALELVDGPVLPPLAGRGPVSQGGLAGQPGRLYAKVLEGLDGTVPVPYWRPNRLKYDTRLLPERTDRVRFRFQPAGGDVNVVARLIYRRFSKYLADQKAWPGNEVVIVTDEWSSSRTPNKQIR